MTIQSKGWLLLPRSRGLAAFHLHEVLDERRERNNDGKPESEFNLKLHGTSSLTLRFSGQPPSCVDLRTMESISSKKNRVSCCDLHCLWISCTRFAFSLLNLCLHLSLIFPTHPFIMYYDFPRQTLYLLHSIFLNLGVSNLGAPRCLKWTWSVSIIRRARQFKLIRDTDVSEKLIT